MLTDFQNSFILRLSSKRIMKESLNIPPYLKRVATYLVKCKCQETTNNQKQNVSLNNKF